MYVLDGQWYMEGIDWDDEGCIHSSDELLSVIESVGFLPLFSSGVPGFSVEEMTDTSCWWSGDISVDPWEWRAVLARTGKVAYGKFYGGRAGFISKKWFPYFANCRRDGYDFDALYEDGKAGYREKLLMDLFVPSGVDMWNVKTSSLEGMGLASSLYTNEMKEKGGFGKGGEKNFEGTLTKLQMQTYLIVKDFRPRLNKRGEEYGWAVAIMTPPEYLWGYKHVTSRYKEKPSESFSKIAAQIGKHFDCDEKSLKGVI
jgi:hypothetical protein